MLFHLQTSYLVPRYNLAEWLRRLTWVQKVPGSSPGSDIWCSCHNLLRGGAVAMVIGAKLTVEAQVMKAENMISVGHCVIPLVPSMKSVGEIASEI